MLEDIISNILYVVLFLFKCLILFVLGEGTYVFWKNVEASKKLRYFILNLTICIVFFILAMAAVIRFFLW